MLLNKEEKKFKDLNGKVFTACFLRDFFASFLFLSLEEKIDAIEVLS